MSVDREGGLLGLASSISDGVPLDWNQIEAAAPDDSVRRSQSYLRMVATIAEVHRNVSSDPGKSELKLWGRLEIREKLGRGAFGEVHRAWDPDLQREVALKLAVSGQHQDAAIKEARALAQVRHNNVVTVYGVDRHGDQVGLWMDLIRGRTLESILKDHGPLGGREAALVGVELCRALAAVHARRLVHGDVKAQNVMREEGGRIVLMDFGLVRKDADDAAMRGYIAGTPLYMAPELLRGESASVRSDVFALGVLLYHLVTGAFPASGSTRDTAGYAGNAKLLHDLRPDLPENFVQVIERALAADPAERFSSAGEMLRGLSGALGSERPAAAAQDKTRPLFRPAFIPVLALLTIVAIVFLVYWIRGIATYGRSASIAVLFENLDSEPDAEYLSQGVADDVTSRLTRVKALRVVVAQWSAVRRLKAHDDLSEIAGELRVSSLLTGSVRKTGDKIRVSVKLLDPHSKSYLWSETYERDLQSVLGLGNEIAQAVVPKLATQFAGMQLAEPSRSPTAKADAYQLYLKGRYFWNKRTPEEIKRAIEYFQHAVTVDPAYALAYAGLADCYSLLVEFGNLPAREAMPVAKSAALRARELDDSLAEAHASLGNISTIYDWDWAAAESSFLRALQLNPGYAMAHVWYAKFLSKVGQLDLSVIEGKRAADLDPLSLPVNTNFGAYLYYARRYEDAREQLEKTLELDATFPLAHF